MKKVLAIVLALAMVLALAACGGSKTSSTSTSTTQSAVVKIGVYEPQSGDNGAGGKQEILGMQYANSVQPTVTIGGTEYTVELVYADNESSNDKAVSAASQLIGAGCSVILGSYGSGVSIAASDTFAEAGIPAIGVTCTNPQVTEGNDHYFRICFLDPFQGTVMANFAKDNFGAATAYCLGQLGNDYDQGLINYFKQAAEGLGMTVVTEAFPEGNSDFTSYLTNAKNAGADVIFAPCSTSYAQLIIEQAATQGVTMPLLAGDTWDSNVILAAATGKDLDIEVSTFYQEGANESFESGFKAWISGDATNLANNGGDDTLAAVSVMGYDAYFTALAAMQQAGSTAAADIMAALPSTTYTGITGEIKFDAVGDAERDSAVIKKVDTAAGVWEFVAVQGI